MPKASFHLSPKEPRQMTVRSDIEIARDAKMKPIMEIGKKLGIPEKDLGPEMVHAAPPWLFCRCG